MTKNPQQTELRRSDKGATTQDAAEAKAGTDGRTGPGGTGTHGTDRGAKGGGRGGGVPPEQRPDHP